MKSNCKTFKGTIWFGKTADGGKAKRYMTQMDLELREHIGDKTAMDGRTRKGFIEVSIRGIIHNAHQTDYRRSGGADLLAKLRDIPEWEKRERIAALWDKWHLNGMRAGCAHQVGPEWEYKDVTLYHFRLKSEVSTAQRKVKEKAEAAIKAGETFTATPEETRVMNLPYSLTHHEPTLPEATAGDYEPKRPLYAGDGVATETKSTGWLNPSEHPEGFLCKPCPTCGYKYGSEWRVEPLPPEIAGELCNLFQLDAMTRAKVVAMAEKYMPATVTA